DVGCDINPRTSPRAAALRAHKRPGGRMRTTAWKTAAVAVASVLGGAAGAHQTAKLDFVSVGRGAPMAADLREYEIVGTRMGRDPGGRLVGSARNGGATEGVETIPVDLFTSEDF